MVNIRGRHGADERELLRRWRHEGDRDARARLAELMLPFVRSVARRYANRGESLEDLVQVGSIGLLKAIDRFDLDRGVKLTSFAEPNISGEIKRHFRDRGWSVHVSRDVQELSARVARATEVYGSHHGRSPSVAELAEHLDVTEERVVEALLGARSYTSASLNERDEDGAEPIDRLPSAGDDYSAADRRMLIEEAASALQPRERVIVLLRYHQGLTQREIAARVGISQMHVSRLLRRSIERMREQLTEDGRDRGVNIAA